MRTTDFLIIALTIRSAEAVPQTSTSFLFQNITSSSSENDPATSACANNCFYNQPSLATLSWLAGTIITTVTQATVIALVNNRANATSYTTLFNTDLGDFAAPTTTNAGGTVTTHIVHYDRALGRDVTATAAYPNPIWDYPESIAWSGVLATSLNGSSQCLTQTNAFLDPLPSHPFPSPTVTQAIDESDHRGWHYLPFFESDFGLDFPYDLFPDYGVFENCTVPTNGSSIRPGFAFRTAAFVTVTSTSHVVDLPPSETPAPGDNSRPAPSPQPPPGPTSPPPPPSNSAPPSNQPPPPQNPGSSNSQPSVDNLPPVLLPGNPNPGASSPNPAPGPGRPNLPALPGIPLPRPQPVSPSAVQGAPGNGLPSAANSGFTPPEHNQAAVPSGIEPAPSVTTGAPAVNIGGQIIPAIPQPQFINNGVALLPGAPATQVSRVSVFINPDAAFAVVGGSTQQLAPGSPLSVGSQVFTPVQSAVAFAVGGTVVSADGPAATVSGNVVSIASGGSQAAANGITQNLAPAPIPGAQLLTIGFRTFTANAQGESVVDGQTLSANGAPITLSGIAVSLGSGFAIVGSSTQRFQSITTPPTFATKAPLTIGNAVITPNAQGQYAISGTTLRPGQVATISGTVILLDANGQTAVVGGSTQTLLSASVPPSPSITAGPGVTFTADVVGKYVFEGHTLMPGAPALTVDGVTVSLGGDGSYVVVNGVTSSLRAGATDSATATDHGSGPIGAGEGRYTGGAASAHGSACVLRAAFVATALALALA